VITDQTMPGMSGEAFASALLDIRPDLPVILATGDGDALGADQAKAAGFQDVIRKPLSIKKIRQVIDGVFADCTS
jgi:FixJ family two-component response regulator